MMALGWRTHGEPLSKVFTGKQPWQRQKHVTSASLGLSNDHVSVMWWDLP